MSDLFGNHIVGFPTRRLIYIIYNNSGRVDTCQGIVREIKKNFKVRELSGNSANCQRNLELSGNCQGILRIQDSGQIT